MKMSDEAALRLAAGILDITCKDYIRAIKGLYRYRNKTNLTSHQYNKYIEYYRDKKDIEKFYGSDWFRILTKNRCLMTSKEITDTIIKKYKLEKYL